MADNDEVLEALEDAEAEDEAQDAETEETDAEGAESGETTEGATPESAAEQIAALAARIDGIAGEISEIRRWFKMSTVAEERGEDGPEDLSFDALADFIIGEN